MAGKSAILTVKILSDASQAGKGVDQATSKFDKFQSGLGKVTPYAVAAGAGLFAVGKSATDAAAKTEQAMGSLETVFGKQSSSVKKWAADSAQSVGLAESEYATLAAQVGGQLQNMGLSQDESAAATQRLIEQGADLAATYGGTTADAVGALGAALRGEADPAERYALALNQTKVNSELAAKGMDDLTGDALATAKAQTTLGLITEQAAASQGQFAREADTASGAAERNAAAWENARSNLGDALLPALTLVTQTFAALAGWVSQNTTFVLALGAVVAGFVVTVLAANAAIKIYQLTLVAWSAATKAVTIAQRALNAVMRANPIGIVITVIIALIAGIVALWKKNEGFRKFVTAAWKAIANVAKAAWNGIKSVVGSVIKWVTSRAKSMQSAVASVFRSISSTAKSVWNAIKSAASSAFNGIRSIVNGVVSTIKRLIRGIKSVASGVWNAIRSGATSAFNAILSPIRAVKSAFDTVISAIQRVIGWIGKIKMPSMPSWLSSVLPGGQRATLSVATSGAPGAAWSAPSLSGRAVGAPALSANAGGGGITINVTGTLNDTDSARAVRRVLRNDSRRRGGVQLDRRLFEVVS